MPPIYDETLEQYLHPQQVTPEYLEPLNIPKSDLILVIKRLTRSQTISVLAAASIKTVKLKAGLEIKLRRGVADHVGKGSIAQEGEPYQESGFNEHVGHPLLKHLLKEALDDQSKIQAITSKIVLLVAETIADQELSKKEDRSEIKEERQAERKETNTRCHKELVASIKKDPRYLKETVKALIASNAL